MPISKTFSTFVLKGIHYLRLQYLARAVYFRFYRLKNRSYYFKYRFGTYNILLYSRRANEFPLFLARRSSMVGERYVITKLLELLKEGDCAYDVGASIGTHSILMARKVGPDGLIVSFEPEPNSFQVLEKNVALNHLENIRLFPVALGNTFENKNVFAPDSGLGSFNFLARGKDSGKNIQLVRGDDWIHSNKLRLPDVIKIDVEGYEYFVLQGLRTTLSSRECKALCCELHPHMLPSGISEDDVIKLIRSFGFNKISTHSLAKTYHVFCFKGH